ncbi:MAG TPA: DoxX family protein [Verrucomicrobiae bacterium]|nr:DoxX family protein [Verrucomicrobiae bacterium]
MKAPYVIGRMIFGGFFLKSGIDHIRHKKHMAKYAQAKGVPKPEIAVVLSGVPLIIGGASLLLGVKPRLGAIAVLGFLAGVSPIMHDFWQNEDPNERQTNMINFAKNIALAGGALAMLGVEDQRRPALWIMEPTFGEQLREIGKRIAA